MMELLRTSMKTTSMKVNGEVECHLCESKINNERKCKFHSVCSNRFEDV